MSVTAILGRLGSLQRLRAMRSFLAAPLDPETVTADVQLAIETRERRFLDTIRRVVYAQPASPYRALLHAADCTLGDLEDAVRRNGLEATLETLRDAGVHVTADELKGRCPIVRNGIELEVAPSDFNNRELTGSIASGGSSGSSGGPSRPTTFGKQSLTEYAADFLLLLSAHDAADLPTAIWMPAPPGSGILVALAWAKMGNPPERWFSQTKPAGTVAERLAHASRGVVTLVVGGVRLPRPQRTELANPAPVVEWLRRRSGLRIIKAFPSSAVRVARHAAERGIDLSGTVAVMGGEPIDAYRAAALAASGVRSVGHYVSTEAGNIGLGCGDAPDDYHVCLHRLAAIPAGDETAGPVPVLLTSLSPNGGKVLLNADIGDAAVMERRECSCSLGRLGLDLHLCGVRSRCAQTSEGMTVPLALLLEIAGELLAPLGGTRDDYQLWETADEAGLSRVVLAVSPRLGIDSELIKDRMLESLAGRNAGARLAADVWRQAGTLDVVVAMPQVSERGKLRPVISVP